MMVTIKTLKERMRQTYPHLSDEEIENTKILIDDRCLSHYIENERVKEHALMNIVYVSIYKV